MAAAPATSNRTEMLLGLPNPFTPMAFLPPELAWELTVGTYWIVGSLAVLIWDILSNLRNDYALLTKYPLKFSMIIYCISRISCLAFITAVTVFFTAPLKDCSWFGPLHILYIFTIPTISLLFYFRVCALYYHNKFVKAFFFTSWLAVFGTSIILPIVAIRGTKIGVSDHCMAGKLPSWTITTALCPLINDTLVFCATTYALVQHSHVEGVQKRFKVLVFGKYLPTFSRAVLQDGQVYYLATLGLTTSAAVMVYIPGFSPVYAGLIGVPNVVLMNCMICLVYRNVRFGVFRETATNPTVTLRFAGPDTSRGTDDTQPTRISFTNQSSLPSRSMQISTGREDENRDEEKFQLDDLRGSNSGVDMDVEVGVVKYHTPVFSNVTLKM